ncbi:MAG TPA: L-arabinose isomerase [Treponemataceae bacterium]|nr:L-arabinose isomerase [Treponemataceae bacterium]
MITLKKFEYWFLTGSQDLYGDETLRQVAEDSKKVVDALNADGVMPCPIVWKPTLLTADGIRAALEAANADEKCAGVIAWMHTFSPAKMWIAGLSSYRKPLLQLNTQFNRDIPYDSMDMDFMNLNQSAHGDREFGFITARMDMPRKVIVGHWGDPATRERIALWMRAGCAVADGKTLRIARFGDNMRDVAVTDGDKVEAMIKLGWSVPYYGIGDLVAYCKAVKDADIDALVTRYEGEYEIVWGKDRAATLASIREQARIEIAMRAFFKDNRIDAFTTNFQDLHGLPQLPGLACQRLMADGFGFSGEGDWKTAAMVRTFKVMAAGLGGGNSFMEDYTYSFEPGKEMILGAHMLEVCPTIAAKKPRLEVHPLGIGGKEDPARLVFNGKSGPAICAAIVDFGTRFRCVVNELSVVDPPKDFPKLPVARVLWKPEPNLRVSAECWILAGGGHHTAFSNILTSDMIRDWAEMSGVECAVIDKAANVNSFRNELRWNAAAWRK